MKLALGLLAFVGAIYVLVVIGMIVLEPKLVFPAPRIDRAELTRAAAAMGAEEVELTSADGTPLYGWRFRARAGERGGQRGVIYFSGNGSTVGGAPELYRDLVAAGFDVLHVNYRGYPGSGGSPTEAGLRDDARAAWAELNREIPAERIAILGRSLGGGVAVGLAAEVQPALLVLSATFHSIVEVAAAGYPWLPVNAIMKTRFDSGALAGDVRCPVLIMHGTGDELIDPEQARELAARFPAPPRVVWIDGAGHNDDLLDDTDAERAFFEALAQIPGGGGPR